MQSYRKLIVYQKAKQLILMIYKATNNCRKTETYSLVPQMRHAAISAVANIVGGYSKESAKEYARFLTISIGSLTGLEVYLVLSLDFGFIKSVRCDTVSDLLIEIKKLLYGTRRSIRVR